MYFLPGVEVEHLCLLGLLPRPYEGWQDSVVQDVDSVCCCLVLHVFRAGVVVVQSVVDMPSIFDSLGLSGWIVLSWEDELVLFTSLDGGALGFGIHFCLRLIMLQDVSAPLVPSEIGFGGTGIWLALEFFSSMGGCSNDGH
ncbi:hypothetical protein Salat_1434000 [Sesamum alatum]|uniref:Uncharacterized protein n=1 Tax=Sesamum alatum TaxID=300844 RepID=A0AAE1YAJ3_9LAMI|nr:hypothetical protein Salat_1434000 [Sesamum alatum]